MGVPLSLFCTDLEQRNQSSVLFELLTKQDDCYRIETFQRF